MNRFQFLCPQHKLPNASQIMSCSFLSPNSSHFCSTSWCGSHLFIEWCSEFGQSSVWTPPSEHHNLVFMLFGAHQWFTSCVNPSVFWSLLLAIDSDTYTYISWVVFLIWTTVIKGYFFFHTPQLFFVSLSSPLCSFTLFKEGEHCDVQVTHQI